MTFGQRVLRALLPDHEADRRELRACTAFAAAHAEDLTRTIVCRPGMTALETLKLEQMAKK